MHACEERNGAAASARSVDTRLAVLFRRSLMLATAVALVVVLVGINAPVVAHAASNGYADLTSWTVSGQTASAKLLGTRAADGHATFQQSTDGAAPVVSTVSSGHWAGALISHSSQSLLDRNSKCLDGLSKQWTAKDCFTRTATLTFPQPVVDPELLIGLGGVSAGEPHNSGCVAEWENLTISAVNGQVPGTTALDATSVNERAHFANGVLSISDEQVKSLGECLAPNTGASTIRIRGLVSSVTFTYTYRAMITREDGRSTGWSIANTGGVYLQVAVPSVDLAVAKTGATEVSQNDKLTWTISVANNGGGDSHGFVVKDAVPDGVTNVRLVSAPTECILVGSDLLCQRAPDECSVTADTSLDAVARLTCAAYLDADQVVLKAGELFEPIVLSGVATSRIGTTILNTATVAGVDSDPDATNNSSTASSSVLATLTVYKSFPSGRRDASDQVTVEAKAGTKVLGTATTAGDESGLQNQQADEYVSLPVAVGTKLTISEAMSSGSASSLEAYSSSWECYYVLVADRTVSRANRTVVASGSGASGTFTFPESLPAGVNRVTCEFSNAPRSWTVAKSATVNGVAPEAGGVSPGDVIDYTVTATNTGAGDVDNVVLTDDLSDVLDDATFVAGSAKLKVGNDTATPVADPDTASSPGLLTTAAFTLPAGQEATLTYSVTVKDSAWLAELTNRVSGTGGPDGSVPPTDCDSSQSSLAQQCTTTNHTNAAIEIEKVDQQGDARIDGSAFEVLGDMNGQPGEVLTQYPAVGLELGLFGVSDLPVGTYWLREIKAPAGFSLLAQPVQFTVRSTGTVVIGQNGDGVVTAASDRITVRDHAVFLLPATGGPGIALFTLSGVVLLVAAGVMAARRRSAGGAAHR